MPTGNVIIANRKNGAKGIDITRGTWLGNPFSINPKNDRAAVIEKYRAWLRNEYKLKREPYKRLMELVEMVRNGEAITLVCFLLSITMSWRCN